METGRPTWRSRAWLIAATVLFALALALAVVGVDNPPAVWGAVAVAATVAVSVLSWALARTRTQRRQYEEDLATWASERATQAERLRIAGDLHDLVSHGLGLITVRAAVARRRTGPDGETERAAALADIEHVSRETTTELRRMLAVLRAPGAAPLRPADTLDDLPGIVQAANTAGLTAAIGIDDLGEVSPGVQLTVCIVVREALNNTIRHAGPTRASIGLQRNGDVIVVDVQDAGPRESWQPQPGAGHGLDGLRERVTALGGTLHAEPEKHGFRLVARIPDRKQP
ncbi:hypothetical protein GCM10027416_01690 [Okibacterium endophyticum]